MYPPSEGDRRGQGFSSGLTRVPQSFYSWMAEQANQSLTLTSWAEEEVEAGQGGGARLWGTEGCAAAPEQGVTRHKALEDLQ